MSDISPLKLSTESYIAHLNEELKKIIGQELNIFEYPKIDKLSINAGVGKLADNKQKDEVYNGLLKLTGQKPKKIASKKSIASFKLRSGDIVGMQVTLRGKKIYDFLLKLIYTALPRGRDFKGVNDLAFDRSGKTYSLGIPIASIFPAIGFGTGISFGIQTSVVFKTNSPHNKKVLEILKMPFIKH